MSSNLDRARALVLQYGWNATSYQILNPGIEHWFSVDQNAVIGFVRRASVRVVAGGPICAPELLEGVVEKFEDEAHRAGDTVCYFGAAGRLEETLRDRNGYAWVTLGGQPSWHPGQWLTTVEQSASLRAQLNRARNKGLIVEEWPSERAPGNSSLQRCLDEWLATRKFPTMHFLVEPQTLDRLWDRRIFVASMNGAVVGFVVLSPVAARRGWLVEQIIRGHHAPNGTAESMLHAAIKAIATDNAAYVTLGLIPLWKGAEQTAGEPLWLRATLAWVRAHGRRFYDFEGLEAFKSKFLPQWWEPIYAISTEQRVSVRTLWAIGAAFTERPVVAAMKGGMMALRQELRWMKRGQASPRR